MSCSPSTGLVNGAPSGSGTVNIVDIDETLWEYDFVAAADHTFVNGANVLDDGVILTGQNIGAATRDLLEGTNGTGLIWAAPTSQPANQYDTAAQTAAALTIAMPNIPNIRSTWSIAVEVLFGSFNFENNGDQFGIQFFNPAASPDAASNLRMVAGRFGRVLTNGGQLITVANAAQVASTSNYTTSNVFGVSLSQNGTIWCYAGTYGTTWPTNPTIGIGLNTLTGALNPYFNSTSLLVLAFRNGANDATPTTGVVIERIRVRKN